jgi:hypothetical protein
MTLKIGTQLVSARMIESRRVGSIKSPSSADFVASG